MTVVVVLKGHNDWVMTLWYLDSKRIASGSADNSIIIWNASSQQIELKLIGHTNWVTCVSSNADGSMIVSGDYTGIVKGWDSRTGIELFSKQLHKKRISGCYYS